MTILAGTLLGWACAIAGVSLLRAAWARRGGGWRMAAGWVLLALAAPGWALTGAAPDKAVGFALLVPSLVALAWIAAGAEWRRENRSRGRPRREPEIEPPLSSGAAWRGWARAVCVGPLGGLAAVGVGALAALHGPGSAADRLVLAGFLTPLAWAAAAIWATTDARIGRPALALALAAGAAFGMAAL